MRVSVRLSGLVLLMFALAAPSFAQIDHDTERMRAFDCVDEDDRPLAIEAEVDAFARLRLYAPQL